MRMHALLQLGVDTSGMGFSVAADLELLRDQDFRKLIERQAADEEELRSFRQECLRAAEDRSAAEAGLTQWFQMAKTRRK